MIEPTETESKETLDEFIDAMIQIAEEAQTDPSTQEMHLIRLSYPDLMKQKLHGCPF